MTLKHLFGLVSAAWALLWIASAVTMGGLMGNSFAIFAVFLAMAFAPPALLYGILFWAAPRIAERLRRRKG